MTTSRIKTGDVVRRVGECEIGEVIEVSEGYAIVDYKLVDGKLRIALMPIAVLDNAESTRADPALPQF